MENKIKIGDFAKITGCTVKTIIYYHKIGLMQEPKRSSGGYRLYGSVELTRMKLIKYLKSLGFDLKKIKEVLGNTCETKTLKEALKSLRIELVTEGEKIKERVSKIDMLLEEDDVTLDNDTLDSSSFQMITDILGTDQIDKYVEMCPELFEQQRKIFHIMDDFQLQDNYSETFRALAEYFKAHPQEYQISLNFGARLAKLDKLSEDDPEIEALARESAEFIKRISSLKELLYDKTGLTKSIEGLYNDMLKDVLSPARMKYKQLFQEYLNYKFKK